METESQPPIIHGVHSEALQELGHDVVSRARAYGRSERPSESSKTPKEVAFINAASEWIAVEAASLGAPLSRKFTPSQVHVSDGVPVSTCSPMTGSVDIPRSARNEGRIFDQLLHEGIHELSFNDSFFIRDEYKELDAKEDEDLKRLLGMLDVDRMVAPYRSGYRVLVAHKKEEAEKHSHLDLLNEAVTQKLTLELFGKHQNEIPAGAAEPQIDENVAALMDSIIKRIAETKGETPDEVWRRYKKGLFTGEMMHIRDIEQAFGPGSLKIMDKWKIYEPMNPFSLMALYRHFGVEYKGNLF